MTIHLPSNYALCCAFTISHCWRQAAGLQEPLVWHSTAVPPLCTGTFLLGGGRKEQQTPSGQCQREHPGLHPIADCAWSGIDILLKMRLVRGSNPGMCWGTSTSMHPSYSSSEKRKFQSENRISHTKKMEIWHSTHPARIAEILWLCPNTDWELIRKL